MKRLPAFLIAGLAILALLGCQPANIAPSQATETPELPTIAATPASPGEILPPAWPTERGDVDRQAAMAAIRAFEGNPNLAATYLLQTGQSQNSQIVVETFTTGDKAFDVAIDTGQVMEMRLENIDGLVVGAPLGKDELTRRARGFMLGKNPCFAQAEPYLWYETNDKGGDNFFFRWTASPNFAQISMKADGQIYHYTDSGICRVDFTRLPPSPTPTITPTPLPIPNLDDCDLTAPEYAGWIKYANSVYGFSFCYPPDWSLEEKYDTGFEMDSGHNLMIFLKSGLPSALMMGVKQTGDPAFILPTGVGHGEFFDQGMVTFLGEAIQKKVLIADGQEFAIHYGFGEIVRGARTFSFILDTGYVTALTEEVKGMVDLVIQSVKRLP